MSASDCVAKMTLTFFLRSVLEPLADARGKHRVIEEQPGFIGISSVGAPSNRSSKRANR